MSYRKKFEYTSRKSFIVCPGNQNAPKTCYVPEQTNLKFWLPLSAANHLHSVFVMVCPQMVPCIWS